MNGVDPRVFEYVLSKITEGFLFERFAQDLLCQIVGVQFVPVGKIHDRAIDGLEHCSSSKTDAKTVYQISIDANPKAKIDRTLATLKDNGVICDRLFYVTNRAVESQDLIEEEFFNKYRVAVRCRDVAWLRGNVNTNEGTIRTYLTFIESHFHQFVEAGKSHIITDFGSDPRIFVFLRQQWDRSGHQMRLDDLLTDSLILFALEGTDPDKGKFMSREDILAKITIMVSFPAKNVEARLNTRLEFLATKPRRINHHNDINKYCLPYATRLEMEEQNLTDRSIYETFQQDAQQRIKKHLATHAVQVQDAMALLEGTLNRIFKQQGLEFANFIIKAENRGAVERLLPDIISEVVDSSSVVPQNRGKVKNALLGAIRDMIYTGNAEELEYIRRLAHSYMMLFLVQCDPKICAYFATMASNLNVFVCTSILIPALSEFPLPPEHRRHWNLLVNAQKAGVDLLINRVSLRELVEHIRIARSIYQEEYEGRENIFADMSAVPYIKEILLRSFFYSLANGAKWSFDQLLDQFVTPVAKREEMERELIVWLRSQFGIKYIEDEALGVTVDPADLEKLASELKHHKASSHQARNDAQTILSIFALRGKNNESGECGVFGYRSWWLSKDRNTQLAVTKCFGDKYPVSCYIRPDFLLNYISLAPSHGDANSVFDRMFPTLMGVTLSHHIPPEVSDLVHQNIKAHTDKSPARVHAILRTLADRLKTDDKAANRSELKHYLDEQFRT